MAWIFQIDKLPFKLKYKMQCNNIHIFMESLNPVRKVFHAIVENSQIPDQ